MSLFLILFVMSTECDLVMQFFRSLNLHVTDIARYNKIPLNCCNYNDAGSVIISCTSNTITSITMSFLNINGTINGNYLPPNITMLDIRYHKFLKSQIPNNLPNSLKIVDFSGNSIRGPLPSTFPTNLETFTATVNLINGSLRGFQNNIQKIDLYNNVF
eukprot:NODE_1538_length_880_cov_0.483995.p1 type:complete len:159 gc:universal NODE_1538_length_880_cov_0.483995:238-714(+)